MTITSLVLLGLFLVLIPCAYILGRRKSRADILRLARTDIVTLLDFGATLGSSVGIRCVFRVVAFIPGRIGAAIGSANDAFPQLGLTDTCQGVNTLLAEVERGRRGFHSCSPANCDSTPDEAGEWWLSVPVLDALDGTVVYGCCCASGNDGSVTHTSLAESGFVEFASKVAASVTAIASTARRSASIRSVDLAKVLSP